MSDFEINKLVAEKALGSYEVDEDKVIVSLKRDGVLNVSGVFNPCNNPLGAWPIILYNKITIEPVICFGDLWSANISNYKATCANPLRAAMIVFLMISEK